MGVRGLCKFVDENPHLYIPFKLHDTRVIMDGSNLVHYLYTYSKADFMFGGNYGEFADAVREYFASFKECNVEPIVIFDGGLDASDRMFQKLLERHEDQLEKVKTLINTERSRDTLLPLNTFEVFKHILLELDIKFAQCDYEGDNQIAALANDYQCPVLSDDSDFYIFDLQQGFIRLSHIDTRVQRNRNRNGRTWKYLKCDIYYIDTLLQFFPLKDENVLPLLAVLAGNDYSCYEDFKHFFYQIKISHKKRFVGLLSWLRNYKLNQAIKKVLQLTEEEKQDDIEYLIETSIEDYQLKPTNLKQILETRALQRNSKCIRETRIVALCGIKLPEQFVIAFHKGLLSSSLLNIITLHRKFHPPQIEEFSYLSSHACSRYIRQVIYGILLQHDSKHSARHSRKCRKKVHEYDRVNDRIEQVRVEFLTLLKTGEEVPALMEMYDMQKSSLRYFIGNVLGVAETFFVEIPNNLQLFLGCINYWLRNCSPKPTIEFLNALLLGVIYQQMNEVILRERDFGSKNKSKSNIFQSISSGKAQLLLQNIGQHLQKPTLSSTNPLDLNIVHSYNQLQTCVLDTVSLNLLAGLPFESPKLHELLAGTMLYNLTKEFLSCPSSGALVEYLLGKEFAIIELFHKMKYKVLENTPANFFGKKSQRNRQRNKK